MTSHAQVPSIVIANTAICRDADGRYSLNDLHQAAGGEQRHRPKYWLDTDQTKALIGELRKPLIQAEGAIPPSGQINILEPVAITKGGNARQGTYVVKELVYGYAMWISPRFHLQVIRTFDAVMTGATRPADPLLPSEQRTLTEIALAHAVGMPDEVLRPVMEKLWDRLAKRFGVTRASEIPRGRLAEAILYITSIDIRAIANPTPVPEYLTNNDMANLACLIDRIQRNKRMPQAWRFSIWKDLRRVTRTKSPDKLEVRHLPDMADELLRIHTAVAILDTAIRKTEKEVLRRVFRNGEAAEQVVAELEAQILTQAISDAANMTKALDAWQRREVQALRSRQARTFPIAASPEGQEPKEVAA